MVFGSAALGQVNALEADALKPNPAREKMFLPYLATRHGGLIGVESWKQENTVQYYKELWYYCESFYVKKDAFTDGVSMDEGAIDISRYESYRKKDEINEVKLPGFKDALVLLPLNKLIYKPSYVK